MSLTSFCLLRRYRITALCDGIRSPGISRYPSMMRQRGSELVIECGLGVGGTHIEFLS